MIREIYSLNTENRNPQSARLDCLSSLEIARLMNEEDAEVAKAITSALPKIAEAIDHAADAFMHKGRLIYAGAGTSGRLGVLDASECPPTFGVDAGQVIGLLAGGKSVFANAKEAIEDDLETGKMDIRTLQVTAHDVVVGLSASGRTPYTLGVLQEARRRRAYTVSVSCNIGAILSEVVDTAIEVNTGPEVLTGSTRLKAGTAQKMILNMISTGAMVRSGKVFENLMVDMRPTNSKLVARAERMLADVLGIDPEAAGELLQRAQNSVKLAIVMGSLGVDREAAVAKIAAANGFVRQALENGAHEQKDGRN